MADFFRSIGTKIFGVAAGLLALMLVASAWSAWSTEQVNRQVRTLGESLVPLALSLGDVRSDVLREEVALETAALQRRQGAVCERAFATPAAAVDAGVARASRARSRGAAIAGRQDDRLELARMAPMVEQLAAANARLRAAAKRFCAAPPGSAERDEAFRDAEAASEELRREIDAAAGEIEGFVLETAGIVEANEDRALVANLTLIGASSLVGLMLAWLVSRSLTRPIARLREGARAVQAGDLGAAVPVTSKDEIGDVTAAFNEMVEGLRAKEKIKDTFGQYVDPRVVAELIGAEATRFSAGDKRTATVFFSDIAGFTPVAERLTPTALVSLVNAYFSAMSAPIRDRHGIIDKYLGDGIMAFWTAPFAEPERQAELACQAALVQFEALSAFRERIPDLVGLRKDAPQIDIRVALATGEAVVGSVGSEVARSFTVMGDTVNFASRLEGAGKLYGARILIDETTRAQAGAAIEARELDLLQVVGRVQPERIFELASLAGGLDAARRRLFGAYAKALAAYRAGDWAAAEAGFQAAVEAAPDDGPSAAMLQRTRTLAKKPPADWDGVWRMTAKG